MAKSKYPRFKETSNDTILIDTIVPIRIGPHNKKHYESLGYGGVRIGDSIDVLVQHLQPMSTVKVSVRCPNCGNEKSVSRASIERSGGTLCRRCAVSVDVSGVAFGNLVAIKLLEHSSKGNIWLCECACGGTHKIRVDKLVDGIQTHCGCERGRNKKRVRAKKTWGQKIINRDGCCRNCGTKDNLQAHHLNNVTHHKKQRNDLSNGVCLCVSCHQGFHRWMGGTRNKCTKTDYLLWINEISIYKELLPYKRYRDNKELLDRLNAIASELGWRSWAYFSAKVADGSAKIPSKPSHL